MPESRRKTPEPLATQEYEIEFVGDADEILQAVFDDCDVTKLRADLSDPAAFAALMQRLAALRP